MTVSLSIGESWNACEFCFFPFIGSKFVISIHVVNCILVSVFIVLFIQDLINISNLIDEKDPLVCH